MVYIKAIVGFTKFGPKYLKIPINEVVDLEILIVISPRIEKCFSNLDPTKIRDKFNQGEDWNEDHRSVEIIRFFFGDADTKLLEQIGFLLISWLQILVSKQVGKEVRVHGQCDYLSVSCEKRPCPIY